MRGFIFLATSVVLIAAACGGGSKRLVEQPSVPQRIAGTGLEKLSICADDEVKLTDEQLQVAEKALKGVDGLLEIKCLSWYDSVGDDYLYRVHLIAVRKEGTSEVEEDGIFDLIKSQGIWSVDASDIHFTATAEQQEKNAAATAQAEADQQAEEAATIEVGGGFATLLAGKVSFERVDKPYNNQFWRDEVTNVPVFVIRGWVFNDSDRDINFSLSATILLADGVEVSYSSTDSLCGEDSGGTYQARAGVPHENDDWVVCPVGEAPIELPASAEEFLDFVNAARLIKVCLVYEDGSVGTCYIPGDK
ncbi:MAG: hypothetical protein Q8P13_04330 [bacterium]|nr:hypothetical protein [bacterium]